jgi:hypothetical protein
LVAAKASTAVSAQAAARAARFDRAVRPSGIIRVLNTVAGNRRKAHNEPRICRPLIDLSCAARYHAQRDIGCGGRLTREDMVNAAKRADAG